MRLSAKATTTVREARICRACCSSFSALSTAEDTILRARVTSATAAANEAARSSLDPAGCGMICRGKTYKKEKESGEDAPIGILFLSMFFLSLPLIDLALLL